MTMPSIEDLLKFIVLAPAVGILCIVLWMV